MTTRRQDEEDAYLEQADSPPDHAVVLDEYGITGAEEARRESLTARLRRELPESSRYRDEDEEPLPAEEAAIHTITPGAPRQRRRPQPRPRAHSLTVHERLELAEAEISSLVATTQALLDALDTVLQGLEPLPTEEPRERARRTAVAARYARELLIAVRSRPTD